MYNFNVCECVLLLVTFWLIEISSKIYIHFNEASISGFWEKKNIEIILKCVQAFIALLIFFLNKSDTQLKSDNADPLESYKIR